MKTLKSNPASYSLNNLGEEPETVFTFKPTVSEQSRKIADALGTNFMLRQQQHLDRQQKRLDQASSHFTGVASFTRLANQSSQSRQAGSPGSTKDLNAVLTSLSPDDTSSDSSAVCDGLEQVTDMPGVVDSSQPTPSPPQSTAPAGETTPGITTDVQDKTETLLEALKMKHRLLPVSSKRHKSHKRKRREELLSDNGDVLTRSKTMPHSGVTNGPGAFSKANFTMARKLTSLNINLERLKHAKEQAERAIKLKKVFTIQGPYPPIRESLRKRGWVEKFYKLHMAPPPKKSPRPKKAKKTVTDSDDSDLDDDDDDDGDHTDDDDDDHGEGNIPPWEEDGGTYGVMSRIVRNTAPTFIWSVRRDAVDCKALKRDQIINHYGKATFTAKVGLLLNLRNVPWFQSEELDSFFPRCYRLSHDGEKESFIDDYRLTACLGILKWVVDKHNSPVKEQDEQMELDTENKVENSSDHKENSTGEKESSTDGNDKSESKNEKACKPPVTTVSPRSQRKINGNRRKKKAGGQVPVKVLDIALQQANRYLDYCSHNDIDIQQDNRDLSDAEWEQFLQWYYKVIHEDATIQFASNRTSEAKNMLDIFKAIWPQLELDGIRNVWIVKPGAKSRGRGIVCYDHLEDMLKLVSSVVKKDSKYVVQKYIERPLLVYNTKFDIRQWFLVTDWNPLTLWFYKDSYLRFCSQQYTLDDFDESIHLSNNAIQKYCVNGVRSSKLPKENMWSSDEFVDYLKEQGADNVWNDLIYPGMKKAIICSLMCTQDHVEHRKTAFELYGADFMLTENYQPWLIEINSSPSMSRSTKVCYKLVTNVLEDTVKVILDRRLDKNADIGQFELAFKQPQVHVPQYIGMNLSVDGNQIKKPNWMKPKQSESQSMARLSRVLSKTDTGLGSTAKVTATKQDGVKSEKHSSKAEGTSCNKTVHATPSDTATHTVSKSHPTLSLTHKPADAKPGGQIKNNLPTQRMSKSPTRQRSATESRPSRIHRDLSKSVEHKHKRTRHKRHSSLPATANGSANSQHERVEVDTNSETTCPDQHGVNPGVPIVNLGPVGVNPSPCNTNNTQASVSEIVLSTNTNCDVNIGETAHGDVTSTSTQTRLKDHMTSPLMDGAWARTCQSCGSGMNLKLTSHVYGYIGSDSDNSTCHCQQDSITVLSRPQSSQTRPQSSQTRPQAMQPRPLTPSSHAKPHITMPQPTPPIFAKSTSYLPSNKRIVIDNSKLISSVYHKAVTAEKLQSSADRLVLRYTDGGIQKPILPSRVMDPTSNFPRLVSRYVSKKAASGRNSMPMYVDSYRPSSTKLAVISQHFL